MLPYFFFPSLVCVYSLFTILKAHAIFFYTIQNLNMCIQKTARSPGKGQMVVDVDDSLEFNWLDRLFEIMMNLNFKPNALTPQRRRRRKKTRIQKTKPASTKKIDHVQGCLVHFKYLFAVANARLSSFDAAAHQSSAIERCYLLLLLMLWSRISHHFLRDGYFYGESLKYLSTVAEKKKHKIKCNEKIRWCALFFVYF